MEVKLYNYLSVFLFFSKYQNNKYILCKNNIFFVKRNRESHTRFHDIYKLIHFELLVNIYYFFFFYYYLIRMTAYVSNILH